MSTLYAKMDILNISTNLIQLFTQMLNVKVLSREEPFYLVYLLPKMGFSYDSFLGKKQNSKCTSFYTSSWLGCCWGWCRGRQLWFCPRKIKVDVCLRNWVDLVKLGCFDMPAMLVKRD